eukprot:1162125-Pelagomonas_calceolata.AAC.5
MDADLVVTLHTGDDHSPVAQLEWSTEDQPQRPPALKVWCTIGGVLDELWLWLGWLVTNYAAGWVQEGSETAQTGASSKLILTLLVDGKM